MTLLTYEVVDSIGFNRSSRLKGVCYAINSGLQSRFLLLSKSF